MLQKISKLIGFILIFIGIFLMGSRYLNNYFIADNEKSVNITNITAEEIKENTQSLGFSEEDVNFDFTEVRNVSSEDVKNAHEKISKGLVNMKILGAIAMPEANIHVSVLKGLSDETLLSGAGTFYPNQKMGFDNYPVASHNMIEGDQLLSPIITNASLGDLIYLTDLTKIYIYETNFIQSVAPTRIDLVALDAPHPTITLMTCDNDLINRFIVQGILVETLDYEKADQKIIELFM